MQRNPRRRRRKNKFDKDLLTPNTPWLKFKQHKDEMSYYGKKIKKYRNKLYRHPNDQHYRKTIEEYQRKYEESARLASKTDPNNRINQGLDPEKIHAATNRRKTMIKNPYKSGQVLTAGAAIQKTLSLMNPIDVAFWRAENLRAIGYDENDIDDLNEITQYKEYIRNTVDDYDIFGKHANTVTANQMTMQTPLGKDLSDGQDFFSDYNPMLEQRQIAPSNFADCANLIESRDLFEEYDPLNYPNRKFHFFHFFHVFIWKINK